MISNDENQLSMPHKSGLHPHNGNYTAFESAQFRTITFYGNFIDINRNLK
jgi:hypothetical protein